MKKTNETGSSNGGSRSVETMVSKHIISIEFEVVKITCKECGAEFTIIGYFGESSYCMQGYAGADLYCPYCGKIAC